MKAARLAAALSLAAAAGPVCVAQSDDAGEAKTIRPYRGRHVVVVTEMPPEKAARVVAAADRALAAGAKIYGVRRIPPIALYTFEDGSAWPIETIEPAARAVLLGRSGPYLSYANSKGVGGGWMVAGVVFAQKTTEYRRARVIARADQEPDAQAVWGLAGAALKDPPGWYVNGTKKLAQRAQMKSNAVRITDEERRFLTADDRPTLREVLGDGADPDDPAKTDNRWRWSLCHMAAFNPNFADRFALIGPTLARDRPATFDGAFGAVEPQLTFEWNQFLDHLEQGLDPAATAWDWTATYRKLDAGTARARIAADRGWQPSRLTVEAGDRVRVEATGGWSVGDDEPRPAAAGLFEDPPEPAPRRGRRDSGPDLTADGGEDGRGRLVAAVFDPNSLTLSDEIELGAEGVFTVPAAGQVVLRCRDAWGQLDDNRGGVKLSAAESNNTR